MAIKHWSLGEQNSEGTFSHCQLTEAGAKEFPTVKKVEVWHSVLGSDAHILTGIQITYSDGIKTPLYGSHDITHSTFTFNDGERITSMWLGIKSSDRLFGSLKISTNQGRYWHAGPRSELVGYKVATHSGMLLGISGGIVYGILGQLGFYFLEDLASIDLTMDFLTTPDPGSISQIAYDTVNGDNRDGTSPLTVKIIKRKNVINSSTTEESWTETFGVSVSVSGGFFGIGDASAGTEYSYSETKSTSTSHSEEHELAWEGSTDVAPGDYVAIDLFYFTGHFTVEYKAEVVLVGKSGSRHVLSRSGKMNGTSSGVATFKQRKVDRNAIKAGSENLLPVEEAFEDKTMPPNTNEPIVGNEEGLNKGMSEVQT